MINLNVSNILYKMLYQLWNLKTSHFIMFVSCVMGQRKLDSMPLLLLRDKRVTEID